MRALLDTCVVSELQRHKPEPAVESAIDALGSDAFLSVVTIGEILRGAHLLDEGQRQRELLEWLDSLESEFANRILGIDAQITRLWGEVSARTQRRGRQVAMADGLIAATALHHGLQVVTRNVNDFDPTGVPVLNPWLD